MIGEMNEKDKKMKQLIGICRYLGGKLDEIVSENKQRWEEDQKLIE